MPVAQALLCEIVPEDQRGSAFGRLQACTTLAGMLATWFAVSQQSSDVVLPGGTVIRGWQQVYAEVALVSLALAAAVNKYMPEDKHHAGSGGPLKLHDMWSATRKIVQIPSFVLLVMQGVTGGVPWNAMAFMTLYWQSCGYSDIQAGNLAIFQGVGGILGALLGGQLGDMASRHLPQRGRPLVALTSVLLGIPTHIILLFMVPRNPAWFLAAALASFVFHLVACWAPAAANRPMCAELVNSPSERAQIVALWVMIEGVTASFCGAPLVGLLSEKFGYKLMKTQDLAGDSAETADALARALVGVGVVAWGGCALAWVGMLWTFPKDRLAAHRSGAANKATQ